MRMSVLGLCVWAACLVGLVLCQGDIDWGDYVHPPRTAKKYRGGEDTYITTSDKSWSAWYMVEDRVSVVFSVKACSHASILLSDDLGTTDFSLEIALGIENNKLSAIRYPFEMGNLFQQPTSDLLHCNEYRAFWLKWGANIIDVGRGPIVGEGKFLNYLDLNLDYFRAFALGSGEGNSASWKLQENAGDYLAIQTPDQHRYTNMWKAVEQRRFFSFSVKAAGHVHVLLSETLGNQETNIYEIVIGGWDNSKSGIRKFVRGSLIEEKETPNILSPTDYKDFWVGWVNGTIEFGTGQLFGRHHIIRYFDHNPTAVRFLSITTGFGAEGTWWIDDNLGSTNVRHTHKADASGTDAQKYNSTWVESNTRKWFSFAVKTCSSASIVFSEYGEIDPEESYQVLLGHSGNTQSGIGFLHEQGWLDEASTPNILDCDNLRYFWVSWLNHTMRVGQGIVYGKSEILRTKIATDFRIGAYGLASLDDEAEWRFRDTFGERVDVITQKGYDLNQYWRQIPDHKIFAFRVRACSDVHVCLSPTVGHDRYETYYDIVISGWDNTRTQIREVRGDHRESESEYVDTTGLLNCDEFVNLYVSWEGNTVTIGEGEHGGLYEILKHSFTNWNPPKAVSLTTYMDYSGVFQIEQDTGDYVVIYTNYIWDDTEYPTDTFQAHLTLNPFLTWVTFDLRTCYAAQINLTEVDVEGKHADTYKIFIGQDANTRSVIIGPDGTTIAHEDTPNILDCDHSRHFWISWGGGKIQAGRGPLVDRHTFISTTGEEFDFSPAIIGYDTIEEQYGRWIVKENAASNAEFYTPAQFGYYYMWLSLEHKEYLTFVSYACSDVHVVLADRLSFNAQEHTYEVVIGGWDNTRSVIRHKGVHRADVSTEGILQCDDENVPVENFWITWQGGAIVVGKGVFVGHGRFMEYIPVNPPTNIRAAAFSTGYGYDGRWLIPLLDAVISPPVTEGPPLGGNDGSNSLSGGAIAGIIFGCIFGVLLAMVIVLFVLNRRGHLQPPGWMSGRSDQTPIVPPKTGYEGGFDTGATGFDTGAGFDNPMAAVEVESAQPAGEKSVGIDFTEVDSVDA